MMQRRNTLYKWLLVASLAGFIWLYLNQQFNWNSITICFIKNTTGYPCPACGTTRSINLIVQGEFKEALTLNPLGYPTFLFIIFAPMLMIADLLQNKERFYRFYIWFELQCKKPIVYLPSIIFLALNWIWNIYKGI